MEPARPVRFVIRSQGPVTSGEITIEQQQALWAKPEWRKLQTIPVPNDLSAATYDAGTLALPSNTTGSNNIALGIKCRHNVTTASSVICIGSDGANVSNTCFIGNIRNLQTQNADAIPVLIDSAGQLGTMSSSQPFKKDIKPMDKASETILALKPVTFEYKSDKANTPQFSLVAEKVAQVSPDLVVRDCKGEIYSVRYDAVNAMLLNEFLKAHRKMEEQEVTITQLKSGIEKQEAANVRQQKQIEALTAGLQRVSDQLELSKPAPQTVLNDRQSF